MSLSFFDLHCFAPFRRIFLKTYDEAKDSSGIDAGLKWSENSGEQEDSISFTFLRSPSVEITTRVASHLPLFKRFCEILGTLQSQHCFCKKPFP